MYVLIDSGRMEKVAYLLLYFCEFLSKVISWTRSEVSVSGEKQEKYLESIDWKEGEWIC